jgi:hypothetical protein
MYIRIGLSDSRCHIHVKNSLVNDKRRVVVSKMKGRQSILPSREYDMSKMAKVAVQVSG